MTKFDRSPNRPVIDLRDLDGHSIIEHDEAWAELEAAAPNLAIDWSQAPGPEPAPVSGVVSLKTGQELVLEGDEDLHPLVPRIMTPEEASARAMLEFAKANLGAAVLAGVVTELSGANT